MLVYGAPFRNNQLQEVKRFLAEGGLAYEEGIQFTVNILDDNGRIIATGSLADNILKCIMVSPEQRGQGLTAEIVTALTKESIRRGNRHLFVFTKPDNQAVFCSLGFFEITRTADVVLLENIAGGIGRFVSSLPRPEAKGSVGSVVCNCNPFTKGHLYLLEQAAAAVDWLHVFVLSEDKSAFPAAIRLELVRRGAAHLPNVLVHESGPYLISSATFPSYFLKDRVRTEHIYCELDLKIFYIYYALPLGITKRFIGTEPFCTVTAAYNRALAQYLPPRGVEVVEIPRVREGETAISASRVRALLKQGQIAAAEKFLPQVTIDFLATAAGQKIIHNIQDN